MLLLGAGLLMRSFISLVGVDLGFDPRNILVASVAFAPGDYATPADKHRFYEQALQRIASLPGVEAVAATTNFPPFSGGFTSEIEIPGKPQQRADGSALVQFCTEEYFRTHRHSLRARDGNCLPWPRAKRPDGGDQPRRSSPSYFGG